MSALRRRFVRPTVPSRIGSGYHDGVEQVHRSDLAGVVERVAALASELPGLELIVLYGSRARGDAHAGSDWDFAFAGDVDPERLRAALSALVASDDVDLVDVTGAGSLLGYRIARDGVPLFECQAGRFTAFSIDATLRWLDMEPVVRAAHRELLAELGS
jgi:uncharacterized protein